MMKPSLLGTVATASSCMVSVTALPQKAPDQSGPLVDLGYAVHSAKVNERGDYYVFRNIRYSEPPTEERRFEPPGPVLKTDRNVNDGSIGFKCPQAIPKWALESGLIDSPSAVLDDVSTDDSSESEDCLFLDVFVSRPTFHAMDEDQEGGEVFKAPVLIWLFGGGYVFGQKSEKLYNPDGLMTRSRMDGGEGIIYVALNYRLGLFGWLNGNGDADVFPNVALQDQLFALEWVQKYIHLFGGDPRRVTVMGQSAGAGSIAHHLTSSSNGDTVPFQRAILQSPGWEHGNSTEIWRDVLATASFLARRPILSGKDLKGLDSATLTEVNAYIVYNSRNASFTFGPTPDGGYVPEFAERLLLNGHFDARPHLMIGHNSDEVGAFRSPNEVEAAEGESDILSFASESSFACNTRYLAFAYGNATLNYRFQVPPGFHGMDLPFTFYRDGAKVLSADLAKAMQLYFTTFVKSGGDDLGSISLIAWPEYGHKGQMLTFGLDGVKEAEDARKDACWF